MNKISKKEERKIKGREFVERLLTQMYRKSVKLNESFAFLKDRKRKVKIGRMISETAGGRHAFFESNVGIIRKPFNTV